MFKKRILKKIRNCFPILKKKIKGHGFIYFDNASTTQKPRCLVNNIAKYYYNFNSNVNRIGNTLSNVTTILIEKTRKIIKKFINAKSKNEIIFTKGTTESINLISKSINLKKNDEVIITSFEHHSNILPWQKLKEEKKIKIKIIKPNNKYNINPGSVKKHINKNTKIVSLTHISNVFGTILPIKKIVKIIKKINNNTLILLDGAQSIAHIP